MSQKEDEPMNKLINTLLIGSGALLSAGIAEHILSKKDESKCIPYGTRIETPYGKMNVSIDGNQGPVIVLLSGYGTAAPILDFQPLAKRMSAYARVVTVEYLGYGCSDRSERTRSVEHICEELHSLLHTMQYDRYYLMAHSISGVYALYYQHMYETEVCGIIGIDPSVPKQIDYVDSSKEQWITAPLKKSGLMRFINAVKPGSFIPHSADYDAQSIATIKGMAFSQRTNPSFKEEGKRINENFMACRELSYPKHLPILMLLSSRNCKMVKWWKSLHEEQLEDHPQARLLVLEGSHYLHWSQSEQMAEEVRHFLNEEAL